MRFGRFGSTPVSLATGVIAGLMLASGPVLAQGVTTGSPPHYVSAGGVDDGSGSDGGASVGAATGATASGVAASNGGGTEVRSQQSTTADLRPGSETGGTVTHLIGPGLPPADANQSIRDLNAPIFQVAGFGGYVTAPVAAAYDANNNLSTFAGQPGRGSTAVLQQSMNGSP